MPDFFPPNRQLTIEEIVKLTGAKPRPNTPLDRRIRDIAPLDRARSTDITFLDNPKYLDPLATTRAGVCLTAPRFAAQAPDKLAVLVAPEPYRAFVMVARAQNPRPVGSRIGRRRELDHIVEDRRIADVARPSLVEHAVRQARHPARLKRRRENILRLSLIRCAAPAPSSATLARAGRAGAEPDSRPQAGTLCLVRRAASRPARSTAGT
jgi:hypothetical protein